MKCGYILSQGKKNLTTELTQKEILIIKEKLIKK